MDKKKLKQLEIEPNGKVVKEQFNPSLPQIAPSSFPEYSVFPLATAIPMVEAATLDYPEIDWQQTTFNLSRFAYLHQLSGKMVLESPLSKFRITLLDSQASAIISLLSQPQTLTAVSVAFPHIKIEIIQKFIHLLLATKFLSVEPEPLKLELWEFHNLLFHSRSRSGRHDYQTASIEHWEQRELFPTVKPPMSEKIIPLFRPNLELLAQTDASLTQAIETRQSIREYDDYPITIEQLGELLYRCARVTEIYQMEEVGEVSRRPYPCGGARYELEIYPVVQQCEGLDAGLYHYDPLNHQLEQIADYNPEVAALIADARLSSGEQDTPQVLLIITARFGRLFCKYKSLAYALVLKHVGVLYENLYLVATSMNLAPCALGGGNSDKFAQTTGLDYYEESAVGEFMLGSISRKVETQGREGAGEQESRGEREQGSTESKGSTSFTSSNLVVPITQSPVPNPTNFITPSAAPMNNADKLPGLYDLWAHTKGDPEITIVILDGNADLERSCFQGANISKVFPYWHETPEPIALEYYEAFLEIEKSGEKGEAKAKKLQAAIPEVILNRLSGDFHATHIISTIIGQHGSPAPGIAPRCRAINIPLNTTGDNGEFISPINLTRAFELAMKLGANVIHCAACCATQTGIAHDLLARAVKNCQDNNILIVAPTGNDKGECWCIPAILPGVLGVGMMKDNGKPANYSNWGGNYQYDGILAPGENILGAQPTTEETKLSQGTSCAAPIITGLSALFLSLQLQRGEKPNAEAVRQAILNSAIPCDPEEIEEPERCLRGKLNIPGAYQLLTGKELTPVQSHPEIVIQANSESPLKRTENPIESPLTSSINASNRPENPSVEASVNTTLEQASAMNYGIDSPADSGTGQPSNTTVATLTPSQTAEGITPSATSKFVYALGTIGYDFGSEARRDTFKQLMPAIEIDGTVIPPNPYDARQMVDYLSENPSEAKALIWTLNQELKPIYVLEPRQGFAADVYEILIMMLAGQIEPEDNDDFIERVSIPAKTTDKTVRLFSGQEVPVITLINTRGMYGWKINNLVEAALQSVAPQAPQVDEIAMRKALTSFVNKVYFEFQNLGQTSKDRALNFSVTNAFQAASSFAEAISRGMQLDTIEVEKSPFCRINSDCWDVILKFFDQENDHRAKKVYRFTVDVSDRIPVTMGEVRSWSVPK
ncbi:PatA/PatG family cyanobactin maturation protease [Kamptonema animale CS-326]|jgi:cyanobactin maturation PatA/PatG family protease|uniref:PatA/PatG family cyanobactin maturation protease n=1 Tax=Kamptonema animale TaxID=92934 RepID=UPI00232D1DA3|nr:PatA/PatG family cyanobactin maturation protease [Kamptonema animale]MDB9513179.1 PatA/PatG family cyanobactin maturation protease [Kamptonema animale CS-326]